MKKLKIINLFSLLFLLASFAIFLAPDLSIAKASLQVEGKVLNIEESSIYEAEYVPIDNSGINYGMKTHPLMTGNRLYSDFAKSINETSLESSYDLRDKITIEVKDQHRYGLCYAFAGLSALETTIAKNYGEYYNFSEIHIPYALALHGGATSITLDGGNIYYILDVATQYGLALEEEMPYPTFNNGTITNDYGVVTTTGGTASDGSSIHYTYDLSSNTDMINKIKKTTSTISINNALISFPEDVEDNQKLARRNAIKSSIKENGGVYAGFFYNDDYLKTVNGKPFYECTSATGINHGVTLVGWDDNFNGGAYIALNSWGTSWGDGGYFYVSYDDVFIEDICSAFFAENIELSPDNKSITFEDDYNSDGYGFGGKISGLNTFVDVIDYSLISALKKLDKIYIPIYNPGDEIKVSYKTYTSSNNFNVSNLKTDKFTEFKIKNSDTSNNFLSSNGLNYSENLYCFELSEFVTIAQRTTYIAIKVEYLDYSLSNNNLTNCIIPVCGNQNNATSDISTTYFFNGSNYQTVLFNNSNWNVCTDVRLSLTTVKYNLSAETINDSEIAVSKLESSEKVKLANYMDYLPTTGGALYIPTSVKSVASDNPDYNITISKLNRLETEDKTTDFTIIHNKYNPNFDSDSDGVNDCQNIYIEFDSKPENGGYVVTIEYSEETVNKYFKVVDTVEEIPFYNISYNNSDSVSGISNNNPTKYAMGWQNIYLNSATSSNAEFSNWENSSGEAITQIVPTGEDIVVDSKWVSPELKLDVNPIDNFTYDGNEKTLTATKNNTYDESAYDTEVIKWYKNGVECGNANSISLKNVEDSGTYKCVYSIYLNEEKIDSVESEEQTITISPKTLTITPKSSVYKDSSVLEEPIILYSVSGKITNEEPLIQGSLSKGVQDSNDVYKFSIEGLTLCDNGSFIASNYTLELANTDYRYYIVGTSITVSNDINKTYDGENVVLSVTNVVNTYPEGYSVKFIWYKVNGGVKTKLLEVSSKEDAQLEIKDVGNSGTYECVYEVYFNENTITTSDTVQVVISKKVVTIVPTKSYEKAYNEEDPTFEYTVNDLVAGEVPFYDGTLSRQEGSNLGEYAIEKGTLTLTKSTTFNNNNYDVQFNDSGCVLTIKKATLILQIKHGEIVGNQTKVYGDEDPNVILDVKSGLKTGEVAVFTGSITRENGSTVGQYEYSIEGISLDETNGTAKAENYDLELESASLTITERELVLALYDVTDSENPKEYTQYFEFEDGVTKKVEVRAKNLVGMDNIGFTTTGITSAENVGTYTITVISITGEDDIVKNYKLPTNASLTWQITQQAPSYTLPTGLKATYGNLLSTVVLPDGFAWKDGNQLVGNVGEQTFSATYTPEDTDNYTTIDVSITVKVEKRTLTISPVENVIKKYGTTTDPEILFEYSGQVDGEVPSIIGNLTRESGEAVGNYEIRATGLSLQNNGNFLESNYEIQYSNPNNYKFYIVELKLEITTAISKTYDGEKSNLEVVSKDYSSYPNGVVASEEFTWYKVGSDLAIKQSNSDALAIISCKDVTESGTYECVYKIFDNDGNELNSISKQTTITIGVRTLTVEPIGTYQKTYTGIDPTFNYEFSNAASGETPGFKGKLSRNAGDNVGEYLITVGNLALIDNGTFKANNYVLKFDNPSNIKLEITKATLVIEVGNQTKMYGDEDPTVSAKVKAGLKTGETAVLIGNVTRTSGESVGSYKYSIENISLDETNGTAKAENYKLELESASLTINKREITLSLYIDDEFDQKYTTPFGYDKQEKKVKVVIGNVVYGDKISLTYELCECAQTVVGDYSIIVSGIDGEGAENYKLPTNRTFTWKIVESIPENIPNVGTLTATYGDLLSTVVLPNGFAWEDASLLVGDVGTKAFNAVYTPSNNNYTSVPVSVYIEVAPKTITITPVGNVTKKINEVDPQIAYEYDGVVGNEVPSFNSDTLSRADGEGLGIYEFTIQNLQLQNNDETDFKANNYKLELNTNGYRFYITGISITLSDSINKDCYDGTEFELKIESILNTYPDKDSYTEFFGWQKLNPGGSYGPVKNSTSQEDAVLTIKNVEDSGTYKCIYRIYDSKNRLVDATESTTSITIGVRTLTVKPTGTYQKTYTENDPTFVYEISNVVLGETPGFEGELSRNAGDNVGEYSITVGNLSLIDNGDTFNANNYVLKFDNPLNIKLNITKATLVIEVGNQTKVYGDEDPSLTPIVKEEGLKGDEKVWFSGQITRVAGENCGSYDYQIGSLNLIAGAGYASPNNYTLELESAKLTITPRELDLVLYDKKTNTAYSEFIYDGTEKIVYVNILNVVGDDDLELTYEKEETSKTNACDYEIIVNGVNNSNYKLPTNRTFTWKILKANPEPEMPTLKATYGDSLSTVGLSGGFAWKDESLLVGDAGINEFKASYTPSDTNNYNTIEEMILSINVAPQVLTITPLTGQNKTYDGTTVVDIKFDVDGLIDGEEIKTAGKLALENASKKFGVYNIILGSLTLVDGDTFKANNYSINFVENITFEIQKREIVLTFENYENLYFDGFEKEVKVNFTNKVPGDNISLVFSNKKLNAEETNSIEYDNGKIIVKNKGDYYIEISDLKGEDAENYSYLTDLGLEFEIKNAVIIITPLKNQSKIYGNEEPELNYSYTCSITTEGITFDGSLSRAEGENVGSYLINIGDLKLVSNGDFNSINYELKLSETEEFFTIEKREIKITSVADADPVSKTFDGNDSYSFAQSKILFGTHFKALDNCILESDLDKVNILVQSASFNSVFVGEDNFVKVNANGFVLNDNTGNYYLTAENLQINGKINPKPLEVSVSGTNREYNGGDTINITVGDLNGVVVNYEVSLQTKPITAKLVSSYAGTYKYSLNEIIIDGLLLEENGYEQNYQINVKDFEVVISKRVVRSQDIVWVNGTKDDFKLLSDAPFAYNGEDQFDKLHAYYLSVNDEKIWLKLSVWDGYTFKNARKYGIEVANINKNYVLEDENLIEYISINKCSLNIVLDKTQYEKIFDGTNDISIEYKYLSGIINHDDVELKNIPTKLISTSSDVGEYSFELGTLTFDKELDLEGSDSSNYQLVVPAITFKIQQKIVDVASSEINWAIGGELVNITNNTISLSYSGNNYLNSLSATFTYEGTTYPLSLALLTELEDVVAAGNYEVKIENNVLSNIGINTETPISINISVTKKDLYVNLYTLDKVYNGTTSVEIGSYSIMGIVNGEEITLDNNLKLTTTSANVGTNLKVSVNGNSSNETGILSSLIVGNQTSLANYNIHVNVPNIAITKKQVDIIWGNTNLVYNGKEQIPSYEFDGIVEGDICIGEFEGYEKNVSNSNSSYIATIGDILNENYQLSANNTSISFTISPARIKIKTTDITVPEGTVVDYSYEIIEGELFEGDQLTVYYELKSIEGESNKYKILATAYNSNYLIDIEFGTLTEELVNRTFVIIVFGFIIGFFIMEFIVVRVKAVKKAKSMPTLKKQEGDNNGNTN